MAEIKIHREGIIAVLKSDGVLKDLEGRAQAVAAAAGEGHRVTSETGKIRARASVITATFEAKRAEAKERSLSQAVDAARA